jgi:hypothetical protein
VFEGEAGAGADLGFVPGGEFEGETGGDGLGDVGFEQGVFDRAEVHAGVFLGAMGIFREGGVGVDAADAEYH